MADFLKCWKYPSNSSEKFKIVFFHQNTQFEEKTACFADFSILTKIAVSEPYRRGDFFGWFFEMWKIPFQFFWKIQNFVLSSKESVWSKNCMFCVLFNFDQNHCIWTSAAWPFFCLIFWNVENTIPILLKNTNLCSFIKTINLKQKQHLLRTFQFCPKSLHPDLSGVAIFLVDFFGWLFEMLKIPFEFFWNLQNSVLSWKHSVWRKNSIFCGLLNFEQNRCIRTLPAWPFFWLIFWIGENTLPIVLKHSKCCCFMKRNSLKKKKAIFGDLSILTKIVVSGPYRRGHFLGWFFWLIFWNVENTLRILRKHSKLCSFIKTLSLKKKQHVLRTFQFCLKSLYPDLTDVAIFFGWFFEMLKIPFQFFWNIQNVVLSWKQTVWRKQKQFLATFNFDQIRCIRTLPAWPFFWLIFWLIFLADFLKCWKYPSNSSEKFKIVFFHQNNEFEAKTACVADFSILTKITVSGPYRGGHFFGWFFEMWKIPFQFFRKIQNFVLSSKPSVWSKNCMFCGLFNFDQNRCIRTLPAWPFFWLIFWNVENTLPILLKNSKLCSFIKTISLKQKLHVLGTFPFWPKSLYPDHNGVAIFLVDFFGWFFEMLKIPFQFFWKIQHFVLSSKQSVWSKNSMFCGFFNFDLNRCIRTSPAWTFFWSIFLADFLKCWKYRSNSSE